MIMDQGESENFGRNGGTDIGPEKTFNLSAG